MASEFTGAMTMYPAKTRFPLTRTDGWFLLLGVAIGLAAAVAAAQLAHRHDAHTEQVVALAAAALATLIGALWQWRANRRLSQRQWRLDQQQRALQQAAEQGNRDLLAREAGLRHLVASSGAMPYVYDIASRTLEHLDPQAQSLLGVTSDDWQAQGFWPSLHTGSNLTDAAAIQRIARAGERGLTVEFSCRTRGERTLWLRDCCRYVRGDDGQVKLQGVLFDVTDASALRQALATARREAAVGRLSGGLAAEFNNLLTRLMGNLDVMLPLLRDDPRLIDLAEDSLAACERGMESNRLLAAFTGSRTLNLTPRSFQPNRCVADLFSLMRRLLGDQIDIRQVFAPDLWPAFATPTHLESVLVDLAIDARDAMPRGGTLLVRTRNVVVESNALGVSPSVPPGCYACVVLAVEASDGAGVAGSSRSCRAPAPGVVESLIGRLNGQLYVDHVPGVGMHVYISADLSAVFPTAADTPAAHRKKVLVVDDDVHLRRCAVRQLAALDYHIFEAADGPSALALVERHAGVDVLFTDIVMPGGMSGIDLAEAARRRLPALKVLMTSGYPEVSQANLNRMAGIGRFLVKPYRVKDLVRQIEDVASG